MLTLYIYDWTHDIDEKVKNIMLGKSRWSWEPTVSKSFEIHVSLQDRHICVSAKLQFCVRETVQ
jgi:hypothetical protein